jgi:3-deoxy-D-manno-octulosonic acid kinase
MALVRIPTESGAILYDPSRIDHPADVDFEPAALDAAGRIRGAAGGRGSAWYIEARGGAAYWVLRHFRRGGFVARLLTDWYAWSGAESTRSFRELRLLGEIEAFGLPAVRGIAARYVRSGLGYRADLLTVGLPGAQTLATLLPTTPALALWERIGATLRAFHDAGIFHADLNAHNVLIVDGRDVFLVDFDRGERRAPGAWREANLARLKRSIEKLSDRAAPAREWAALLAGYAVPRSLPPR